jgi:hypothetical protein
MLVLGILGTLFCAYWFWYWTRVATMRLPPAELVRARHNVNLWFALTGLCVADAIIAALVPLRLRRKLARGFDLLPRGAPPGR